MRIVTQTLKQAMENDFRNIIPFLLFLENDGDIAESIDDAWYNEERITEDVRKSFEGIEDDIPF